MKKKSPGLFDAVRIVGFPDGASEAPVYYSQTGRSHLRIGDVGVVIGDWLGTKLRIEAVDPFGAIDWQDHLAVDQVEVIPTTDAPYCRQRINDAWAWSLALNGGPIGAKSHADALSLARKVMQFARQNVDVLVQRLTESGYRFISRCPHTPPPDNVVSQVQELASMGVHIPIALEAWLMEVGPVDFCGSHPDWARSGCLGICDDDLEPWFTDPLVINVDLSRLIRLMKRRSTRVKSIPIAPDALIKAGVSGSGPISIACTQPAFDNVLIGLPGSFTLLSYLKHAFDWGGLPGFEFIPEAPGDMLKQMSQGLVRL